MKVATLSQQYWSQPWVFVLALAGSTIGLGNIWKFPNLVNEQGGGTFVLIYFGCLLLLGAPLMMAELALGRAGRSSPVQAIEKAARRNRTSRHWVLIAQLSVLTGFIVFAFYSVVSGWLLGYFFAGAAGRFNEFGSVSLESYFMTLLQDPVSLLVWQTAFVGLVAMVLLKGIRGLDHAVRVLMPVFLLLLVTFLIIAHDRGELSEGLATLLRVDFSTVTFETWMTALGHAFFTLSIGMGALMAYGRYLPRRFNIGRAVLLVLVLDTLVGLLFALIVYGLFVGEGLPASRGPGLLFITMPFTFANMAGGQWLAGGFFLMVLIVAWTSAVALLEPLVQVLISRFDMSRRKSVFLATLLVWLLGVVALLSFNIGQAWQFAGMTVFDLLDFVSARVLLPISGLLLVLFCGWQLRPRYLKFILSSDALIWHYWLWAIRFVVPVLMLLMIWSSIYSRF